MINVKVPLLRKAERYGIDVARVMHDALAATVRRAESAAKSGEPSATKPGEVSDRIAAANLCVETAAEDWADMLHMAGLVAPVGTDLPASGVRRAILNDGWLAQICAWLTGKPAEVRTVVSTGVTIWRSLAEITETGARKQSRRTPAHIEARYADTIAALADDMASAKAELAKHVGDVAPRRA
ncbi:hypothetical protein ACIBG7_12580 [Nonomuraea sp. NPDC050328]|uniref:hypothetical protein n=1 Tax=Nonomuraea sp. NPDC050328 TaxID=3364361 RepID=UPI00379D99F9